MFSHPSMPSTTLLPVHSNIHAELGHFNRVVKHQTQIDRTTNQFHFIRLNEPSELCDVEHLLERHPGLRKSVRNVLRAKETRLF